MRLVRTELGMTQVKLAERLGVRLPNVRRWEESQMPIFDVAERQIREGAVKTLEPEVEKRCPGQANLTQGGGKDIRVPNLKGVNGVSTSCRQWSSGLLPASDAFASKL